MRSRYWRRAKARDRSRGFTLVEVLVALTLLALLASVVLPFTDLVQRRGKEAELRQALITIRTAIDAYKQASDDGRVEKSVDASGYPPDLAALVDGVVDRKNPNGDRIYFLRRLPADPFCGCPGTSAADTWETRSYTSSSDAFASGKDVFDIRSKSGRKGINGIPYSQW
ncbi:type II secretion system protein [Burkholderia anthina]|uniref:GSPG signal peptide protein n=1 Tax=Burkholderia anthina TaxID=179879 RepID=A0A6P2GEP8_9BURK|nr:type II secretion system protein [Burkholderia anthina]MBM2771501.1 type II secretion system protein [Burkholderia anthina]VVU51571.1 GSPG signal peptide protein [Burkholderia anthina]